MFCFKCGQQVQDNAMFCSHCGTRLVEEVKETPVEPVQETVQPEIQVESQPVVTEEVKVETQPAWEVPSPEQPVQAEAQPVWEVPSPEKTVEAQAQPAWEVPQPEQPAEAQPEMTAQPVFAAQAEFPAQPQPAEEGQTGELSEMIHNFQFGSPVPAVEEKKKGLGKGAVIGVVAAVTVAVVVLIAVLVILNGATVMNAIMKTVKSPEDYYKWVMKRNADGAISTSADIYGSVIDNYLENSNLYGEASILFTVEDSASEIMDSISDSAGVDLGWFESFGYDCEVGLSEEEIISNGTFKLNGDDIISFNFLENADDAACYFAFPELTENALSLDMSDYITPRASIGRANLDDVGLEREFFENLPDKKDAEHIANLYATAFINSAVNVDLEDNYVLEAGDVSEKCTKLTLYFDDFEECAFDVELAKVIVDDKVFEEAVLALDDSETGRRLVQSEGYDSAEEFYEEYIDEIKENAEDFADYMDFLDEDYDKDMCDTLTIYVDKKGKIKGFRAEESHLDERSLVGEVIWPTKGKNFGFALTGEDYGNSEGERLITGTGSISGTKLNGTFTFGEEDVDLGTLEIKDYSLLDAVTGKFDYTLIYRFSPEMADDLAYELDLDDMSYVLSDFSIELDVKGDKKKNDWTCRIKNDEDCLLTGEIHSSIGDKEVKSLIPDDSFDMDDSDEYMEYILSLDLTEVMDRLEDAGVPSDLLEPLEEFQEELDLYREYAELGYF